LTTSSSGSRCTRSRSAWPQLQRFLDGISSAWVTTTMPHFSASATSAASSEAMTEKDRW